MQIYQSMRGFGESVAVKRPEENYKYIFKKCLKKLKCRFAETSEVRGCKKEELERRFYGHYFGEIAKKEGLMLESFYQPRNPKAVKSDASPSSRQLRKAEQVSAKDIPKTISAKYIQTISKSKQFLKDFHDHLDKSLLQDYLKSIDRKIAGMFADWQGVVNKGQMTTVEVKEVCEKIEKNTKFKMPWTVLEVRGAIGAVQQLFRKNVEG